MEILNSYKAAGRFEEAAVFQDRLKKAIEAKKLLEKISVLDFNRPKPHLQQAASQCGIDLNDPSIKDELFRIQSQNLKDIKKWIESNKEKLALSFGGADPNAGSKKQAKKKKKKWKGQRGETEEPEEKTGTNFYFNTNYINATVSQSTNIISNYGVDPNAGQTSMTERKRDVDAKLISDLFKDLNSSNERDKNYNKITCITNLVIIILSVGLFVYTIILQSGHNTSSKGISS
eukprot:TRINITY_DN1286_c0_g2_i3.p2 TRINITY_DN1286_c0_g2~~TRINITY_DN1286_c0_g2_i3.p2  ORF type:complete len:232 (+),score=68.34 TRINITY_DN1286_c0_g2_i3:1110-1805(+)